LQELFYKRAVKGLVGIAPVRRHGVGSAPTQAGDHAPEICHLADVLSRIAQDADQSIPSGPLVLDVANLVLELVLSDTGNPLHQGLVYRVGVSQKEVTGGLECPYLLRRIAQPGAVCLQPISLRPSLRHPNLVFRNDS